VPVDQSKNNPDTSITPIKYYANAEIEKSILYKDNKRKAGIYQWTHRESGKIYVSSAIDLYVRFRTYYFKRIKNNNSLSYIYSVIALHKHSSFSISILEYVDITNLSIEKSKN